MYISQEENMVLSSVFEDIEVIGESEDPEWIAAKLQQMKDPDFESNVVADSRSKGFDKGILEFLNLVQDKPWMYATHQFGYIALHKIKSKYGISFCLRHL
jgi:hypothetical protein